MWRGQGVWGGRVSDGVARGHGGLHVGVSCPVPPGLRHPLYPTLPACNVTIHNRTIRTHPRQLYQGQAEGEMAGRAEGWGRGW